MFALHLFLWGGLKKKISDLLSWFNWKALILILDKYLQQLEMVPNENDDLEEKVKEIICHELEKANFNDICKRYGKL